MKVMAMKVVLESTGGVEESGGREGQAGLEGGEGAAREAAAGCIARGGQCGDEGGFLDGKDEVKAVERGSGSDHDVVNIGQGGESGDGAADLAGAGWLANAGENEGAETFRGCADGAGDVDGMNYVVCCGESVAMRARTWGCGAGCGEEYNMPGTHGGERAHDARIVVILRGVVKRRRRGWEKGT